MIDIYTDGSCLGNPGKGGWAFALIKNNKLFQIGSGAHTDTTNNRMELTAIIKAIEFTKYKNINIYSDSKLCINCAEKKWKKKANLDLWQEFETKSSTKNIIFHWVKGHSGNIYNELVDKLAFKEASQILLIKNKNILQ